MFVPHSVARRRQRFEGSLYIFVVPCGYHGNPLGEIELASVLTEVAQLCHGVFVEDWESWEESILPSWVQCFGVVGVSFVV